MIFAEVVPRCRSFSPHNAQDVFPTLHPCMRSIMRRPVSIALPCLFRNLACLILIFASAGYARAALDVQSAILMDMGTGRVLYEQNADTPIPPASLTKVMSMCLTMDSVAAGKATLRDDVKVSRKAARTGGSRMALKPYEHVSLDDLLMGMAVSSGNDASAAVAEHIGGSQQQFVSLMNAKARSLGMSSSRFLNPHGLPAQGQVTTARDMLILSRHYLTRYPDMLRYHSTRYIKHNGVVTYNKNPLLGNYEGADGLKTGWINASGYNLISTAHRGNTRLLAVMLGAPDTKARAREIHRLMEAGFMTARGQAASVAEALPVLPPAQYALNTDKTAREAYAVLAPESLHKQTAKHPRYKKASHKRKQVKAGRRHNKKEIRQAQRAGSQKIIRQASLHRKKS